MSVFYHRQDLFARRICAAGQENTALPFQAGGKQHLFIMYSGFITGLYVCNSRCILQRCLHFHGIHLHKEFQQEIG